MFIPLDVSDESAMDGRITRSDGVVAMQPISDSQTLVPILPNTNELLVFYGRIKCSADAAGISPNSSSHILAFILILAELLRPKPHETVKRGHGSQSNSSSPIPTLIFSNKDYHPCTDRRTEHLLDVTGNQSISCPRALSPNHPMMPLQRGLDTFDRIKHPDGIADTQLSSCLQIPVHVLQHSGHNDFGYIERSNKPRSLDVYVVDSSRARSAGYLGRLGSPC